ncbi:hypothetical protein BRD05_03450 [Halobacteriales archaeon QS_9_70_65]|nr:MAG: hypothetical protein BRD05_03450 [Halobacteriales archaeon QS_9_70_65]
MLCRTARRAAPSRINRSAPSNGRPQAGSVIVGPGGVRIVRPLSRGPPRWSGADASGASPGDRRPGGFRRGGRRDDGGVDDPAGGRTVFAHPRRGTGHGLSARRGRPGVPRPPRTRAGLARADRGVRRRRHPDEFDEPLEVTAAVGNVSHLGGEKRSSSGERFAHTHVTLSRADGSAVGGHLESATTFAGELYVREFDARLERAHDPVTDLELWPL